MKKILALSLAVILMVVFSACRSDADESTTTTAATTVTETFTTVENTATATTTTAAATATTEETPTETTKRAEYDLYKTLTLAPGELPIQFSAEVKEATFNYVPYETRQETGFDFYSVLQVEVNCASQDLVITFPGSETVFPANMPEAVVYSNSNQHAKANYKLDLEENYATMDGFDSNLESVDILFSARYMSTIDMPVGDELYEVTCMQVVFTK